MAAARAVLALAFGTSASLPKETLTRPVPPSRLAARAAAQKCPYLTDDSVPPLTTGRP
jgi:hypothetical protein